MSLLQLIAGYVETRRKQLAIREALTRLNGRALADLGLERDEIPALAHLGARLGPEGATLAEVVARVRAVQADRASAADRVLDALGRTGAGTHPSYTPADLDRYVEAARRLRAGTLANFGHWLGHRLADAVRPAKQAALGSALGRWVHQEMVWRRAYGQARRELLSYSDRELQADLRRSRSEIDEIAAEAADERLAAYVAADPSLRRALAGGMATRRAHG